MQKEHGEISRKANTQRILDSMAQEIDKIKEKRLEEDNAYNRNNRDNSDCGFCGKTD